MSDKRAVELLYMTLQDGGLSCETRKEVREFLEGQLRGENEHNAVARLREWALGECLHEASVLPPGKILSQLLERLKDAEDAVDAVRVSVGRARHE